MQTCEGLRENVSQLEQQQEAGRETADRLTAEISALQQQQERGTDWGTGLYKNAKSRNQRKTSSQLGNYSGPSLTGTGRPQ